MLDTLQVCEGAAKDFDFGDENGRAVILVRPPLVFVATGFDKEISVFSTCEISSSLRDAEYACLSSCFERSYPDMSCFTRILSPIGALLFLVRRDGVQENKLGCEAASIFFFMEDVRSIKSLRRLMEFLMPKDLCNIFRLFLSDSISKDWTESLSLSFLS